MQIKRAQQILRGAFPNVGGTLVTVWMGEVLRVDGDNQPDALLGFEDLLTQLQAKPWQEISRVTLDGTAFLEDATRLGFWDKGRTQELIKRRKAFLYPLSTVKLEEHQSLQTGVWNVLERLTPPN